jgi:hypothetical protein
MALAAECDIDAERHGEAVAQIGWGKPAALHVFFTFAAWLSSQLSPLVASRFCSVPEQTDAD